MPKKVLILGGEGNGVLAAEAIIDANQRGHSEWQFAGFINDRFQPGEKIAGYEVKGGLADCRRFVEEGFFFINTILKIGGQQPRIHLFESLQIPDENLATFVHPLAYLAPSVKLGPGCVVLPHVAMSPGTIIGKCTMILAGVTIAHDCRIGGFCHFAAQSCLGAHLKISDGVHIGLNATIREHNTIGKYAVLGMGSVLTKSIPDREMWLGVPARKLRMAE